MVTRPHFQKLVERAASTRRSSRPSSTLRPRVAAARAFRRVRRLPRPRAGRSGGADPRAADKGGLDIARLPIVDMRGRPAAAGRRAAELARAGACAALVRGSLSQRGPAGAGAAPESGLRTERRLSHALLPRPARPAARPAARRRAHERHAEPRRQARHRPEHDPARASRSASPRRTSRCWRRWTNRRRRFVDADAVALEVDGDAGPVPTAPSSTAR